MNTTLAVEQVLVVKIGGAMGINLEACADDIACTHRPMILVHGVSGMMDALCAERGHPIRTLTSPTGHTSRYTDPETRTLFVEAAERMNAHLVRLLQERRVTARGFTREAVPLWGERKTALRAVVEGRVRIVRDDYSGTITEVRQETLLEALQSGQVAVVPPLANSADGLLNVDGDRAGAMVAGAVNAGEYLILSGVRGLYRQFPDESSFVPHVQGGALEEAMIWAEGRMKRKVIGATEALSVGVSRVVIGDGRRVEPIRTALAGAGTEFRL